MTSTPYLGFKHLADRLLALLALLLLLPLLLLLALLVHWRLGAPVFHVQERSGRHGRPFRLFKFRSLLPVGPGRCSDAERMTPFGRRLRASSLDELPQLLNVLRGEMSLVGPRPLPPAYLPLYSPRQARRLQLRPGLTGWAQVSGRNSQRWRRRFACDVWYVRHCSLVLDLLILVRTPLVVLGRRGISAPNQATMAPFTGRG
jgi:lipopolysaccharide/colanic/teichoic acid biosynthesis glycosyltransferase